MRIWLEMKKGEKMRDVTDLSREDLFSLIGPYMLEKLDAAFNRRPPGILNEYRLCECKIEIPIKFVSCTWIRIKDVHAT